MLFFLKWNINGCSIVKIVALTLITVSCTFLFLSTLSSTNPDELHIKSLWYIKNHRISLETEQNTSLHSQDNVSSDIRSNKNTFHKSAIVHTTAIRIVSSRIPENDTDRNLNDNFVPSSTSRFRSRRSRYHIWRSSEIHRTLRRWKSEYPNLIRVTTAQDMYGLPAAGGVLDCPLDGRAKGCPNYFAILQDYVTHPVGSNSSNRLPDVLWSGALHGNERVGPTAVMAAAHLLLQAATCEASLVLSLSTTVTQKTNCRQELRQKYGMDDTNRQWLSRLLSTRRIVIVPTANALGYYRRVRTEGPLLEFNDPNRDFPYDIRDPKKCMTTITARTLNEIFLDHLFQMSLTFHGGTELIGYEWGATSWRKALSPDDVGQDRISSALSQYSGSFRGTPKYKFGDMNDIIYAVRGGMEDWAYAGSFDPERVVACTPTTFGGYPSSKTTYDNSTLRAFNLLIETSRLKQPPRWRLGTWTNILEPKRKQSPYENGHISRNVRLALAAADLVRPYVLIQHIGSIDVASYEIKPLIDPDESSCDNRIARYEVPLASQIVVEWVVGGALEVDETMLYYASWEKIQSLRQPILDCSLTSQPNRSEIQKYMKPVLDVNPTSGNGTKFLKSAKLPQTIFRGVVSAADVASNGGDIVVIAVARVDQSWTGGLQDRTLPKIAPQSHIVNARNDPTWFHENKRTGKVIQGYKDWFSLPKRFSVIPTE